MTQASFFDAETEVTQHEAGLWHGQMSGAWNIGDNPNGGYMLSCALRAVAQSVGHADPISVTTHFLRPGTPGVPFEVLVDVLRKGRNVSTIRATLSQAGKARLELLCAFGDLSQPVGVAHTIRTEPQFDLPTPDDCPQRSGKTQGLHLPIMERLDVRLNPAHAVAGMHLQTSVRLDCPDAVCQQNESNPTCPRDQQCPPLHVQGSTAHRGVP